MLREHYSPPKYRYFERNNINNTINYNFLWLYSVIVTSIIITYILAYFFNYIL